MKSIWSALTPVVILKFVVGFHPVDLSVLKAEKADSAVHLVVIHQTADLVVLRQAGFQRLFQFIIRRVSDTQDIDAVLFQTVAEIPVSMRKIRRDKYKVHMLPPVHGFFYSFEIPFQRLSVKRFPGTFRK